MSQVSIVPVDLRRDLDTFIALPYDLHRRDSLWVPQLRRDMRAMLSPAKNPFFDNAEAQYFLARREGKVVGRIAAIHNRAHNAFHEDRVAFFGFFESVDDQAVANGLFEAAAGWLRERQLEVLRGPANFSTNDDVGLLVDGFETPPTLMMPHNPRYYLDLVEGAGFTKAKDLLVFQSTQHERLPERLVKGAELLAKRYGISIRPVNLKRFDEELMVIKDLYRQAWERNWGFVPMTEREMDHVAGQLRQIVVPELVCFAERQGKPIGFAVALPDFNVALKKNPSGRLFPGILRVLWAARKIDRTRILLLGTIPEWRGRGIDALLYKHIWEKGVARGFRWGEAGWILEDNVPMINALGNLGFEVYKTYRMYDRPL